MLWRQHRDATRTPFAQRFAKARNLLAGGLGVSARDLSTLLVVRAVEVYLKDGGRFGFVMPHGVLTRKVHTGFRTGDWSCKIVSIAVTR